MTEQKRQEANLDKVTDYVEDEEIGVAPTEAMSALAISHEQQSDAERQRELELAAVSVRAEDVQTIVDQLEVSRDVADRTLRIHKGDIIAALRGLIRS